MNSPVPGRVLIADGDGDVRRQLFSALLGVDVFADVAGSVTDAMEKLDQESYGLVMVDLTLAGGDPADMLAKIAQLPVARRPVVIVVATRSTPARSLDVEVVQIVMRKPLALRQTVEVIRSCVAGPLHRPGRRDENGDDQSNGDPMIS